MSKATLGAGNVDIELDGETVTLRPTLKAAQTISRQAGGIVKAIEAIGKFDLDAMVGVIQLGLNLSNKDAANLAEKVWATGMAELSGPVINYLSILANGGRPISSTEGGEGDDSPR